MQDNLFKKDGEPHISNIEKALGLGKVLSHIKHSNPKKYEVMLLGAIAYLNKVSIEDLKNPKEFKSNLPTLSLLCYNL